MEQYPETLSLLVQNHYYVLFQVKNIFLELSPLARLYWEFESLIIGGFESVIKHFRCSTMMSS